MIVNPSMKVRVNKLIVITTGTYNEMYYRPFRAYMDPEVEQELVERLDPTGGYNSSTFSGMATKFIKPDAITQGMIHIEGGWNKPRMRWIAEVEWLDSLGTTFVQILTGYTEHDFDLSYANSLSPDLEFYINNSFMFRIMNVPTPQGIVPKLSPVTGGQIFANKNWNGFNTTQHEFLMRPSDVIQNMDLIRDPSFQLDSEHTYFIQASNVTNDSKLSKRSNASPSTYMSRLLEGHRRSYIQNQQSGGDDGDISMTAINNVRDGSLTTDYFLNSISSLQGLNYLTNGFTLKMLYMIDPSLNTENRIQVFRNEPQMVKNSGLLIHQTHQTGNSSDWGGSDILTQSMATLAHAIPGIMADCALSSVTFMSSNSSGGHAFISTFASATGFLNGIDLRMFLETFKTRVEDELLYNLSYGHQKSLEVSIFSDILGDTRIELSLDGITDFKVIPTFCDSSFSPVKAYDQNHLVDLSSSFQRAMDITENRYLEISNQISGFSNPYSSDTFSTYDSDLSNIL